MPSMALPSTGKVAPAWAKEEDAMDDAVGARAGAVAGSAAGTPDGCSRRATRFSRASIRVVSRFRTSGRSSIVITRVQCPIEGRAYYCCRRRAQSRFDIVELLVRPGRQQSYEDRQNDEGKNAEDDRREQSFLGNESHLVSGVSEEALGEELAADDHVPAHGEDADLDQASRTI